jgi:hypothetical protein
MDGDFIVTWASNGGGGDAKPIGLPGNVNGFGANQTNATVPDQPMAWGVYAQQFHHGAPAGGEFRVNIDLGGDHRAGSIAMSASGHITVAWTAPDASGLPGVGVNRYVVGADDLHGWEIPPEGESIKGSGCGCPLCGTAMTNVGIVQAASPTFFALGRENSAVRWHLAESQSFRQTTQGPALFNQLEGANPAEPPRHWTNEVRYSGFEPGSRAVGAAETPIQPALHFELAPAPQNASSGFQFDPKFTTDSPASDQTETIKLQSVKVNSAAPVFASRVASDAETSVPTALLAAVGMAGLLAQGRQRRQPDDEVVQLVD